MTKNNVKYRLSIALIRGIARFATGARTNIRGHTFESKDRQGMDLLMR